MNVTHLQILIICFSVVTLKILVHNNQIDVINGEEGINISKIMSETDTKIAELR